MQNKLDDYKKIIKSLDTELPEVNALLNFINSYDGTNVEELEDFLVSVIPLLVRQRLLNVKSDSYDTVLEIVEETKEQIAKDEETEDIPVLAS